VPAAESGGQIIDLMEALRASLSKKPAAPAAAPAASKESERKPAKRAPRAANERASAKR